MTKISVKQGSQSTWEFWIRGVTQPVCNYPSLPHFRLLLARTISTFNLNLCKIYLIYSTLTANDVLFHSRVSLLTARSTLWPTSTSNIRRIGLYYSDLSTDSIILILLRFRQRKQKLQKGPLVLEDDQVKTQLNATIPARVTCRNEPLGCACVWAKEAEPKLNHVSWSQRAQRPHGSTVPGHIRHRF